MPARKTVAGVADGSGRGLWHTVVAVFRDPIRTFLVLALAVGMFLACVVPHFAGIDEPAHFYRSYQISTGKFLPEK